MRVVRGSISLSSRHGGFNPFVFRFARASEEVQARPLESGRACTSSLLETSDCRKAPQTPSPEAKEFMELDRNLWAGRASKSILLPTSRITTIFCGQSKSIIVWASWTSHVSVGDGLQFEGWPNAVVALTESGATESSCNFEAYVRHSITI